MKHIFVNLKRFDVPAELDGVNRLAPPAAWAEALLSPLAGGIQSLAGKADFTFFFPEAHLLPAVKTLQTLGLPLTIGCQGLHWQDLEPGKNFGALTTARPAAAAKALGCLSVLAGHCEERNMLAGILEAAGARSAAAVNALLRAEIEAALGRGLSVLYCIGEKAEERDRWEEVLRGQLTEVLAGLDESRRAKLTIAYEPVWAIGPGKTPPDAAAIRAAARCIKETAPGLPVVYGGGLKRENAAMLAGVEEIDGGLIALTRFSGDIGFYPDEFLEICRLYLGEEYAGE
jgi:triosephosphate isomerase